MGARSAVVPQRIYLVLRDKDGEEEVEAIMEDNQKSKNYHQSQARIFVSVHVHIKL